MYKTCRHYALLPKDLKVPICYDRTADPLYHGGYGDVWKGGLHNREVAVKVIRTCSSSDLAKVVGVSFMPCSLFVCSCADDVVRRDFVKRS